MSNRMTRDAGYSITRWQGLHFYLDGWLQFDGHEYLKIADGGYWYRPGERSPVVWFPLYPLLIRAGSSVVSDPMIAGMIVTAIAGLVASVLYWQWLTMQGMSGAARVGAFLGLLWYPYGWYLYGPVQSDALFLALVLGAFLLIQSDRMVWAGVIGALATATRPTAMAVIPALIVLGLEHDGVLRVPDRATGVVARFNIPVSFDRSRLRARSLAPGLCILGLGSYMTYLGVRFGDPIAFINNQRVYHPGNLPWLKRAFFVAWRDSPDWTLTLTLTGQAIMAGIVIVSVPFVGRRFGWGAAVFVGALVAIPTLSTEDFMGTGRYLMAAFPAAALIGERLVARGRLGRSWFVLSAVLLVGLNMAYSRSWYLT